MKKVLDCNHKNKKIHLYPDFSSTGVWCECGVSFGDPVENFPHIPRGIFDLVQIWNDYWDDCCFLDSYWDGIAEEKEVARRQEAINEMGKELSKIIYRYHECLFLENNSKIFLSKIN